MHTNILHDLANCHSSDVLNDSLKERDDVTSIQKTTNYNIPNKQLLYKNMEVNYSMASSGQNTTTSEIKDISELTTSPYKGESAQPSLYNEKR